MAEERDEKRDEERDEHLYQKIPQGRLIYCRKDLNRWLEIKEAFVLLRWFQRISDKNLFPVMIIDQINRTNLLDHPSIRYYLLEYESYSLNQISNECYEVDGSEDGYDDENMNYLEEIGFIHICYSKDDLPIFIYQNKII